MSTPKTHNKSIRPTSQKTHFGRRGAGAAELEPLGLVRIWGPMADGDEERDAESGATGSERGRMSAMGVEIEPDLEAPLLGTLESIKPQSRVAPLIVLLVFIIVVILLASMMGNLASRYSQNDMQPP